MIATAAMGAPTGRSRNLGQKLRSMRGDKMGIKPFPLGKGGFEDGMLIEKSCGC